MDAVTYALLEQALCTASGLNDGWSTRTSMPTTRSSLAAVTVADKVYAIGGTGSNTTNHEYDPGSDTWSTRAPMPSSHSGPAAVAIDGIVHVASGTSSIRYDPGSNTWATNAPIPKTVGGPAGAVLHGQMHVVGRETPKSRCHVAYDPVTNTWTTRASYPSNARNSATAVAPGNGKMYFIGGDDHTGEYSFATRHNEEYDPDSNTWTRRADMPESIRNLAGASLGGRVYTFGGRGAATTYSIYNFVLCYDPTANVWVRCTPLPTARDNLAAAEHGGKIFTMGGVDFVGTVNRTVATCEVYVPDVFGPIRQALSTAQSWVSTQ